MRSIFRTTRAVWVILLTLMILACSTEAAPKHRSGRQKHAVVKRTVPKRKTSISAPTRKGSKYAKRASVRSRSGRLAKRGRRVRIASRPGSMVPSKRVLEIQNALIGRGFLAGPATGQYDQATTSAMKQFQSTEKLEPTGYPTAPALKKLGLSEGPISSSVEADDPLKSNAASPTADKGASTATPQRP